MGLFADQTDTFRVEFEPNGWVDMRTEITTGDRKFASDRASGKLSAKVAGGRKGRRQRDRSGPQEVEASFSNVTYVVALLSRMIVAWSEEATINEDNIERLPETLTDQLMEALDERSPIRGEEERGPLSSSSSPPSETPSEEEALSAGQRS